MIDENRLKANATRVFSGITLEAVLEFIDENVEQIKPDIMMIAKECKAKYSNNKIEAIRELKYKTGCSTITAKNLIESL